MTGRKQAATAALVVGVALAGTTAAGAGPISQAVSAPPATSAAATQTVSYPHHHRHHYRHGSHGDRSYRHGGWGDDCW